MSLPLCNTKIQFKHQCKSSIIEEKETKNIQLHHQCNKCTNEIREIKDIVNSQTTPTEKVNSLNTQLQLVEEISCEMCRNILSTIIILCKNITTDDIETNQRVNNKI